MHYLGCVMIRERKSFLKQLKPDKQDDIKSELKRIRVLRKALEKDDPDKHLVESVINSRRAWRVPRDDDDSGLPSDYDLPRDIRVPIIHFDAAQGQCLKDSRVWGTFPSQKTNLKWLLTDDNPPKTEPEARSLFEKAVSLEGITYFHIPYNNMIVSDTHTTI